MKERHERTYFGRTVTVSRIDEDWHPYPWRFAIADERRGLLRYAGIPNQCATRAAALRRAWVRCKWLADGTYDKRYVSMVHP
jgi:hypothetical protein